MLLGPLFQLSPISTLPILTDTRDTVKMSLYSAGGVICIAEYLSPECVKAVRNVRPFSALWFAEAIFGQGDVDNLLQSNVS